MSSTKQTLAEVLSELSGLISEPRASFDGLIALNAARESIDVLYTAYVNELSRGDETAPVWDAIATAVSVSSSGADSAALGKPCNAAASSTTHDRKRINDFWADHSQQFQWDFLPMNFLYELYFQWMREQVPNEAPLNRHTFTRRLKSMLDDNDRWTYQRSRPGCLMREREPLAQRVGWRHDGTDAAIYGLRRSGV